MKNIIYLILVLFAISCRTNKSITSEVHEVEYKKYFVINDSIFNIRYKNVQKENKELTYSRFSRKKFYKLVFKNEESVFSNLPSLNNTEVKNEANGVKYYDGTSRLYRNLLSQNYLIANNRDKGILIQDSVKSFDWNLNSNEEREFLGYKIKKATSTKGLEPNTSLIAWYAPDIKTLHGPYLYWGLPGLILELEVNFHGENNNFIKSAFYTAEKIKITELKEKLNPNEANSKIMTYKEWEEYMRKQNERVQEYNRQGVDTSD